MVKQMDVTVEIDASTFEVTLESDGDGGYFINQVYVLSHREYMDAREAHTEASWDVFIVDMEIEVGKVLAREAFAMRQAQFESSTIETGFH